MNWVKLDDRSNGEGGGEGPLERWTTTGQEVEGEFHGFRGGKYGPQSMVVIGTRTFAATTVLKSKFEQVTIGSLVKVVYLGKLRSAGGAEYANFDVYVAAPSESALTSENYRAVAPAVQFAELIKALTEARGLVVTNALIEATKLSEDPYAALVAVAAQVGVVVEDNMGTLG